MQPTIWMRKSTMGSSPGSGARSLLEFERLTETRIGSFAAVLSARLNLTAFFVPTAIAATSSRWNWWGEEAALVVVVAMQLGNTSPL